MNKKQDITFEKSLIPWLGRTMKLIHNEIDDILANHDIDLSKQQFILLTNIEKKEGLSQKELAFFSKRNKSSLARMISTLERKKYIIKQCCTEDKRQHKIRISDLGYEVLTEAAPYFSKFVTQVQENISNEEKEQLINILNKIQNNIIGEGPSPFFKNQK